MCFNCRLSALIWGYLHPNQVNGVGITTVCICASHLLRDPKVMGQNNNHKSNFHFLILGCKSFAVNYSLKSGTHRHHQTLGFILVMLCQASAATVFSSCLFLGHFPFSFVFSKWNACSIGFRSGDWLGHCITVHFFPFKKLFGCFCSMLWVIVHLHCEAPSNEFWSIWLNMSR